MKNFTDLFAHELRDIYSAEIQIEKLLPLLAKAAHLPKLKEVFQQHHKETKQHITRLETIANDLNINLEGRECEALEAVVREAKKIMKARYPHEVRDAALISCAQRVEHYEITVYGTLKGFAKYLDFDKAEELLNETLKEEQLADKKLTAIAAGSIFTKGINEQAARKSA
ncbi:MAG: ferritin-like domain-containing protein [Chlamydiales bacterium]